MDADLHALLAGLGIRLLPVPAEVKLRCTCTDTSPCAHVAALLATWEERLGRNPFLLFRVRGIPRESLLEGCQLRRQASFPAAAAERSPDPPLPPPDRRGAEGQAQGRLWWGDPAKIASVSIPSPAAGGQTVLVELGRPARIETDSEAAHLLEDAYALAMDLALDASDE
jgi:uncharacterized Zn finger protein